MRSINTFWFFAVLGLMLIGVILTVMIFLIVANLSPEEKALLLRLLKNNGVYLFTAGILLLAGIGFALDGIFHVYILPIGKLSEETALIFGANSAHRLQLEGSQELVRLAQSINRGAERYEALENSVDCRVRDAKIDTEEEKNILAAVISELPEGVLICNAEGQILLYNRRARTLLIGNPAEGGAGEGEFIPPVQSGRVFIGLGRSVFGLIDKNIIDHALEEIEAKMRFENANALSYFVVVGQRNNLLRVEAAPIVNPCQALTGFILILSDITERLEADNLYTVRFQALSTALRASLASVRSAIEVLLEFPQMAEADLRRFNQIIHKEAVSLEAIADEIGQLAASQVSTRWPLVPMAVSELAAAVSRRAAAKLAVELQIEAIDTDAWVQVESYSMTLTLLFVMDQIRTLRGCRDFGCRAIGSGGYVDFDITWKGEAVKIDTLRQWEKRVLSVAAEQLPLTVKQVLRHHGAEIWPVSGTPPANRSGLRLFLPLMASLEPGEVRKIMVLPESRPEFYDFDLFNQPGQTPDLDNRLLSELVYTVFDTETTGLDPRGGDEIISIGAVRIVNGRLLKEEVFDQLIDPRRSLPPESTEIHGITPEMLEGQPTIDSVLPLFHRFAEDTILLAHNAAFDMRMLQVKEAQTGVRFINPVLDTLLLSAVVHPAQEDHNLEAIAARIGISVLGRHTALGDAIVTGEMFLRLLPLLEERGIRTLREARRASEKTYYARLKY